VSYKLRIRLLCQNKNRKINDEQTITRLIQETY